MFFVNKPKAPTKPPAPPEEVPEPSTPVVEVTPPTVQGHGDDDDDKDTEPAGRAKCKACNCAGKTCEVARAWMVLLLTFAAFVLLLMASLSVPTIHPVALLRIKSAGLWAGDLGVFGLCYAEGPDKVCTPPAVGYTLPFLDAAPLGVIKKLSGALLVNPIAAGLAGLALLARLGLCDKIPACRVATTAVLALAALGSVVAFALNLAFVLVARAKVSSATGGEYTGHIHSAFWFSVAAMPAIVAALVVSRVPRPAADVEAASRPASMVVVRAETPALSVSATPQTAKPASTKEAAQGK